MKWYEDAPLSEEGETRLNEMLAKAKAHPRKPGRRVPLVADQIVYTTRTGNRDDGCVIHGGWHEDDE